MAGNVVTELLALAQQQIDTRVRIRPNDAEQVIDDPLALDDAARAELGLPALPGEDSPLQQEFVRGMTPLRLRRIPILPGSIRPRTAVLHAMGGEGGGSLTGGMTALPGRWGNSRNWSGAVIASRDGGSFTSVQGAWTVPAAGLPDGAEGGPSPPKNVWRQSVWIGLDGYRACSRSLPQVGTVSEIGKDKKARYYLWVQWWVRDKFYGEGEIEGFDVKAGDQIRAWLRVVRKDNVEFVVTNLGLAGADEQPRIVTIDWASGKFDGDKEFTLTGVNHRPRGDAPVEGRHAVWCVERPSVMPPENELEHTKPHQLIPFEIPRFERVVFTQAIAAMRLADGSVVERDLTAARRIRMVSRENGPVPRTLPVTAPVPSVDVPLPADARIASAQADPKPVLVVKQR